MSTNKTHFGSTQTSKFHLGSAEVSKVYLGNNLVYEKAATVKHVKATVSGTTGSKRLGLYYSVTVDKIIDKTAFNIVVSSGGTADQVELGSFDSSTGIQKVTLYKGSANTYVTGYIEYDYYPS